MRFAKDFFKSKTTWSGIVTVITTLFSAYHGKINPFHALLVCLGSLHLVFLRDTISKWAEKLSHLIKLLQSSKNDGGEAVP